MVEIIRARRGYIKLLGIRISPEEPFVVYNGTQQLSTTPVPRAASKGAITWSGGSSSSVSVDANGLITGKKNNGEATATIYATSDVDNIRASVIARCGYNVTAISFPSDSLTIEGIQGIVYTLSITPSSSTTISFGSSSSNETVSDYQFLNTTYGNGKRVWGLSVGNAVITLFGRSGNAQFDLNVTVTPVQTTGISVRGNYNSDLTSQGDYIPPVLANRRMFVDQRDSYFDLFFEPFNATERDVSITLSDDSIAEIYPIEQNNRNFGRGTFRFRRFGITSKAVGTTVATITGANGTSTTLNIIVMETGGQPVTTSVTGGSSSATLTVRSNFSLNEFYGWTLYVQETNINNIYDTSEAKTNYGVSFTKRYDSKMDASKTASIGGAYLYYYNKEGQKVTISNVSGSWSF